MTVFSVAPDVHWINILHAAVERVKSHPVMLHPVLTLKPDNVLKK